VEYVVFTSFCLISGRGASLMSNLKKILSIFISISTALALLTTAYSAYKGHANDSDINALLAEYPKLAGTTAD
jgi:hypothetical protein